MLLLAPEFSWAGCHQNLAGESNPIGSGERTPTRLDVVRTATGHHKLPVTQPAHRDFARDQLRCRTSLSRRDPGAGLRKASV